MTAPQPATNLQAGIKSLTLKGIKENGAYAEAFINSNVAGAPSVRSLFAMPGFITMVTFWLTMFPSV